MRPSWTWRFGASGISSFPYSVATKTSARTLLPASLSARSRPSVVPAKIAIFFFFLYFHIRYPLGVTIQSCPPRTDFSVRLFPINTVVNMSAS